MANADAFGWEDSIPDALPSEPWIPIMRPKRGSRVRGILCTAAICGKSVHYWKDRTHPCTEKETPCFLCPWLGKPRWHGYLGIWLPSPSRFGIVELSRRCVNRCPELVKHNGQLAGFRIDVWRTGEAHNAPLICQLSPPIPTKQILQSFDLKAALVRIWEGSAHELRELQGPPGQIDLSDVPGSWQWQPPARVKNN
jgi:hypothetical protein